MFYVKFLSLKPKITINLSRKAHIALLLTKKVIVLAKYLDFANIFFKKSVKMLPKRIKINEYAIQLIDSK